MKIYPVFEQKNGTSNISVYRLYSSATTHDDSTEHTDPSSGKGIWIFLLVVVIILLVLVLAYFQRLRVKKREIEESFNVSSIRM